MVTLNLLLFILARDAAEEAARKLCSWSLGLLKRCAGKEDIVYLSSGLPSLHREFCRNSALWCDE